MKEFPFHFTAEIDAWVGKLQFDVFYVLKGDRESVSYNCIISHAKLLISCKTFLFFEMNMYMAAIA
jgi:hypothetical protein